MMDPVLHPTTLVSEHEFVPAKKVAKDHLLSRPSLSYWQDAWMRLKKNKQALASLGVVIGLVLFTVFGPLLWTMDPNYQDLVRISEGPTLSKQIEVIADPTEWEEIVVADFPALPDTPVEGDLPAPQSIELVENPTKDAVRIKWNPVPGASGYAIYRSNSKPKDGVLGVPIGQTDAGNKVSYQDQFELKEGISYYSVVALGVTESTNAATIEVDLKPTISLSNAQAIDPEAVVGKTILLPGHPMGTDLLGRDMLARLMAGARVSLFIGVFAPLFCIFLGICIGGISGYLGGRIDNWLMRITDFVAALPFLLFMILFKVVLGGGPGESGILPMLVAMVILSWTSAARLVRGQVLQLRESEFVQAARLLGARPRYLLARHLLPNAFGVILVSFTFAIPHAIFTEAFLSFIGMGVAPPTPSWGSMCNDALQSFLVHPHEFLFPSFFICIAVLAFNFLGDGLRDALDPRMRSVQ